MSKESFKLFVKKHPEFIKYINNGEMTWQKFYETYDIYGENSEVWDKFGEKESLKQASLLGDTSLKDIFNAVKQIDLDTVKKGVDGLQKAVGLIQDIAGNKTVANPNNYQRRPMYKYFED